MTANPAPGFSSHPQHKIEIRPSKPVTVRANGVVIAKSDAALLLNENSYPAVIYIPMSDIAANCIAKSDHTSYCPFKGTASYWNIVAGEKIIANAAWSYQQPFDEMLAIKDHLAFYTNKVEIEQINQSN